MSETLSDFIKKNPSCNYKNKNKNKKKIYPSQTIYFCQCKCGNVFDYRERIRFKNDIHYAPCQGRCPSCLKTTFSFIGSGINIYPIKMNFTG